MIQRRLNFYYIFDGLLFCRNKRIIRHSFEAFSDGVAGVSKRYQNDRGHIGNVDSGGAMVFNIDPVMVLYGLVGLLAMLIAAYIGQLLDGLR
jgi:hypothetical protein